MKLLITAGPTREYLDPVRFFSNGSTGALGYALAEEAVRRGHVVILVTGPTDLGPPSGATVRSVISAEDMFAACLAEFPAADAAIMTAAVADWRPAVRHASKAPKHDGPWRLDLEPTPDICAALGARKQHRILVGFALQDEDRHHRAEEKMARKRCDVMVLNSPAAIGAQAAEFQIKQAGGPWSPPQRLDKPALARQLLDMVQKLAAARPGTTP